MARSYHVFKPTNPRTIRGAEKRGWHVVHVPVGKRFYSPDSGTQLSWLGLEFWTNKNCKGEWVNEYFPNRQYAFKEAEDASKFIFQWCI